jgi:hypothetical protein
MVSLRLARSLNSVIPGRATSREPGIRAGVQVGEVVWIPGSVLRTPRMTEQMSGYPARCFSIS